MAHLEEMMLRTPKIANVWRRRKEKNNKAVDLEPTIRRLELFIAFCGLLIASVTIYTSYLQYLASQSQADIAEATLSPQFSVRIDALPPEPEVVAPHPKVERISFKVVNDGGPAVNIKVTAATYVLLRTETALGAEERYFPLRAYPIRRAIIYSGSAKDSVATVSFSGSDQEVRLYLNSMRRHALLRWTQDGGEFQHRIEIRYDTALGKSKSDLFEIDSFRWSIRKVTKWSWRPIDEDMDELAMLLRPNSLSPNATSEDPVMTDYAKNILSRINIKLMPPGGSD